MSNRKPKKNLQSSLSRRGTNRVRISASFKPGMEIELAKLAEAEGMNKSQLLEKILTQEVKRRSRLKSGG